jgi:hypothetical protein
LAVRRFQVMVHGHGLSVDPECCDGVSPQGFYTTRVIDARSEKEAIAAVIALVLADRRLAAIQRPGALPPKIEVETVHEVPIWHRRFRRPYGFAFYAEEGE